MFPKKNMGKVDYRIKLLSGNNVVLVEANGFESEIFMPEILNGRISFQNIIPNRRCCFLASSGLFSKSPAVSTRTRKRRFGIEESMPMPMDERSPLSLNNTHKIWRMNAGQDLRTVSPMAFSTPAPAPSPATSDMTNSQKNKENTPPRTRLNAHSYRTSDLVRSNVPTPDQVLKDTRVQIPSGIKVIRLYRNQTGKEGMHSALNHSGYQLPSTPDVSSTYSKRRTNPAEPIEHSQQTNKITTPNSITKWRKCLTPVRTYSRRAIPMQRQSSGSSIKKIRSVKLLPSYLNNATQGIKGSQKVEIRRRKLAIDPKITVSPTSFKHQIRSGVNHKKSPSRLGASRNSNSNNNSKHYDTNKMAAFDMLTRSNRSRNVSSKLEQQFKKSCVNKASSTCPKYKILCSIPPMSKKSKIALERRASSPLSALTTAAMMEKASINAVQKPASNSSNNLSQTRPRWS